MGVYRPIADLAWVLHHPQVDAAITVGVYRWGSTPIADLAWVLHHPQVDAAIIGPRTPAHLASALAAIDIALTAREAAELAAVF